MKPFDSSYTDIKTYFNNPRKPDFGNILHVLKGQKPSRPTLFEFFLNDELYLNLANQKRPPAGDTLGYNKIIIQAFHNAGYDYTTMHGSDFHFANDKHQNAGAKSMSLNEGAVITDWESFEKYPWADPSDADYSMLDKLPAYLHDGMRLIVYGPGGVLENVIFLLGFDTLCYLLADDPALVGEVFNAVGSRLVKYYEICTPYPAVGALISNDDWGFNSQTMMSVKDMRKFVFPWHEKIVATIHAGGKPAILHSCGNLDPVMDDIINVIKYDAKHSYEDKIIPVEQAYEKWGDQIAILGGIDLDFICRSTPEAVYNRSVEMLERTSKKGGYALGSGNSIPYYVPTKNYLAMIAAVNAQ